MTPLKGIWYVGFPTYRYKQDVQALATQHGLKIIDARFDADDGAKDVPDLDLKPEYAGQSKTLYDIYKLTDGERSNRASKTNLSKSDAESWTAERPENEYEIVAAD